MSFQWLPVCGPGLAVIKDNWEQNYTLTVKWGQLWEKKTKLFEAVSVNKTNLLKLQHKYYQEKWLKINHTSPQASWTAELLAFQKQLFSLPWLLSISSASWRPPSPCISPRPLMPHSLGDIHIQVQHLSSELIFQAILILYIFTDIQELSDVFWPGHEGNLCTSLRWFPVVCNLLIRPFSAFTCAGNT